MKYKLISAVCRGGGIGKDSHLPWNIKEDLAFFSKLTKGQGNNAVVMGRRTWESIGSRPLPGRENIILSRGAKQKTGNWFKSLSEVDAFCETKQFDQVWVIGGAEIYKMVLDQDKADVACITYIDKAFDCDTTFPAFSKKWRLTATVPLDTTQKYGVEIRRLIMID